MTDAPKKTARKASTPNRRTPASADRGEAPESPPEIREPEQVQREIEETRKELGDTVEALAKKTDVKAQAKRKAEETKANIAEKKDELLGKASERSPDSAASAAAGASQKARENPLPLAALGAFAAGFLAGRITRR